MRHTDVLVAVGVVVILGVMIVPMPTYVMDFLLTGNISVALLVLMMTIYIVAPLEFSVFPGLLLILTLARLSLNVASTRLILSQADAGRLISAFGDVVVSGNFVLGFIIFVIVIIIQFVVITKGAGRVAEVAARFTLDAMPGKQMAIDADLNAGLIDETTARKRREDIAREAEFYGSMDGASKFVRGDAIAGILITLINIIGGLAIGILQHGMSIADAAQTYTLLTVGDGLVTQIPALITSTSAGIIITRASSDQNMGRDINRQLTARPQAGLITGAMLFGLGVIPGMPTWPFLLIGSVIVGLALLVRRGNAQRQAMEMEVLQEEERPEERPEDYLRVDLLEVQVGYQLVPLVDAKQGGELQPKNLLAINPGFAEDAIEGSETTDPVFGLAAVWVVPSLREKAELLGYNVVEPVAVLATHLTEVLNTHARELLGRQEVQHLVDEFKESHPAIVEELIPDIMPLGKVQRVLQNLLVERVPIRDLRTILETLADYGEIKDVEVLTEYVRTALRRQICNVLLKESPDEGIAVLTIDSMVEEMIKEAVQGTPTGLTVAVAPDVASQLFQNMTGLVDQMVANGQQPSVLASPQIRLAFRKLTAANFPSLFVLSYNEIVPEVDVSSVGNITLEYEDQEIHSPEYAGSPAPGP